MVFVVGMAAKQQQDYNKDSYCNENIRNIRMMTRDEETAEVFPKDTDMRRCGVVIQQILKLDMPRSDDKDQTVKSRKQADAHRVDHRTTEKLFHFLSASLKKNSASMDTPKVRAKS